MSLTKSRSRMTAGAPANVLDFGAVLDGITDDTAAWTLALATGGNVYFPEGNSLITDQLVFPNVEGVSITGCGRDQSQFKIDYLTFNMSADSVLKMSAAYQGIHGVGFSCVQPSTAVRAELQQYPPIIELDSNSRAELSELRIEACYVGIVGQGNCGGSVFKDLQVGALFQGFVIDGALDSVRMSDIHCWPFGIAGDADLLSVYMDGTTVAADFGRVDDLNIHGMICFASRLRFEDHGGGAAFGYATNVALDTEYSRLEFIDGSMSFANLDGSTNLAADFKIDQSGGTLRITNLQISGNVQSLPLVSISGDAVFWASNIYATSNGGAPVFSQSGGEMMLSGGYILDLTGTNRDAAIYVAGGRATVTGMRVSDYLGGTRSFIQVDADDYHVITDNCFVGWGYALPATQVSGVYGPNSGLSAAYVSSRLVGSTHTRKITGTLSGGGGVTVAHGVTGAPTNVVSATAFYIGASSEYIAITSVTIDGTNVVLAGGGASKDYVVQVSYT